MRDTRFFRLMAMLMAGLVTACISTSQSGTETSNRPSTTPDTSPTSTSQSIPGQLVPGQPVPGPSIPAASDEAFPPVLLANSDGVFIIRDGALPARLLDGAAAIAVEDTQGGVLFQRETFRTGVSGIWRVQPDTPGAEEILSAASSESLVLGGVSAAEEGIDVWYTRWTGTDQATLTQTVMRLPIPDGTPIEVAPIQVAAVGDWESSAVIRPIADLVLVELSTTDMHGFEFVDSEWRPATVAVNPYRDGSKSCAECPRAGVLSDDGLRIVWLERAVDDELSDDIVVTDVAGGAELARVHLGADAGIQAELDIHGDHVLVNTMDTERSTWAPPLSIDLVDATIELLPVPGRGRIVRSADIAGGIPIP